MTWSLVLLIPWSIITRLIFHCSLLWILWLRCNNALSASAYRWRCHLSRLESSLWLWEIKKNLHLWFFIVCSTATFNVNIWWRKLTKTLCALCICGLTSGDSIGAIHCSINSLSERASDGWLTDLCSERWSL